MGGPFETIREGDIQKAVLQYGYVVSGDRADPETFRSGTGIPGPCRIVVLHQQDEKELIGPEGRA